MGIPEVAAMEERKKRNRPPTQQKKRTKKQCIRLPPFSLASSSAICARCSERSRCSHSEASLPASPSTSVTGGPAVLSTSVVTRKPKIALLHRSSTVSSIVVRSLPHWAWVLLALGFL